MPELKPVETGPLPVPATEASALFQGAIGLGYSSNPVFSFGVLIAATVLMLSLVSFKMRWREP